MSRREIFAVCELAAHLANHGEWVRCSPGMSRREMRPASECAQDAMTLQRLGRSARNLVKRGDGGERARAWVQRIIDGGNAVCKPYWLSVCFDYEAPPHLFIIGLPSNGDGDGFAI